MSKKVIVSFLDKDCHLYPLRYKIYNSNIANKWLKILEQNLKRSNNYIHSFFMNQTEKDFPDLMNEINDSVTIINKSYDRTLPTFKDFLSLDQLVLNDLHEEYEMYGDRIESLTKNQKFILEVHDEFLRLNELIHSCERILKIREKNYEISPMFSLFDFYPQELYESVENIDKIYLTHAFQWGGLYLGYNTLGKDWLEISNHNDLDVILRNQVRSQQRFSAESWFYFSVDNVDLSSSIRFEKWYKSLPDNIRCCVPIENLSMLSLGRFEIGKLLINKSFLNFHDNLQDWLTPNHPIKHKWNLEVFSKFKKITKVEIIDN